MEQGEQRGHLQEYLGGPSAKPCGKDQRDPPLKAAPKPGQVDRNKKDAGRPVPKGAPKDGKLGAKPMQHIGSAAQQKPSAAAQRASGLPPEQPRKGTKLPAGPGLSCSVQPRGKLPAATSSNLHPASSKKPAQDSAAPPAGGEQPHPGAPSSLGEGLQDKLGDNKENTQGRASARPVLDKALQAAGHKGVLTARQSSTTTGIRAKVGTQQAKDKPAPGQSRPTGTGSRNPSTKTRPPRPPTASAHLLHKKPGANQERSSTARPSHVKRSPTKPLASSRPQGPTQLPSSLKLGCTMRQQKPPSKGEAGTKVAPAGHTAASRAPAPRKQPCNRQSCAAPALESGCRGSSRGRAGPEPPRKEMFPGRVPRTPTAADRKRQLQEWLASKGKTYKRPPMTLLQKNPVKESCRTAKKQEEQQQSPEQSSLEQANSHFTECLRLLEEGAQAEEVQAMLSAVPQAERFAKFWICRAKLLAEGSPWDLAGLYRAAVCAGAAPLQELREVVLDMMKAADQTTEGAKAELPIPCDTATPGPGRRQLGAATPCLPISVKLQVTSAPRGRELPGGRVLKLLTPVRRSLRIERAGRHYPEMLKDHDPVVSSLREILQPEEETQFLFRRNEALPEVTELEGVSLCAPECC